MSTLKPIKNIVQEISHQVVLTDLARETMEWLINQAITQDRASIHTSLVAAVEGQKYELNVAEYLPKVKAWTSGYDQPFDDGYEQGKKDTLTIINSIFKE